MKSTSDPHIILKMKVIILLILVPLVSVAADSSTDYWRGSHYLDQYGGVPLERNDLLCLLYQFSENEKCIQKHYPSHGIFRIGSDWCFDSENRGQNLCNINCTKFEDDDLHDDIRCALQILEAQGLYAWGECGKECVGTKRIILHKKKKDGDKKDDSLALLYNIIDMCTDHIIEYDK